MVVAGRVTPTGDVAIAMVEAESTEHTWNLVKAGETAPSEEVVAAGLEAAKPFIKVLCDAQTELAAKLRSRSLNSRSSSTTPTTCTPPLKRLPPWNSARSYRSPTSRRASRPPIPSRARLSSVWRRSSRAAKRRSPAHTELSPRSWFGSGS